MLSTVILTKNSEKEIENCISSVAFSDEILVVDDNSTDKTGEIAKKSGATVVLHTLDNDFAAQRNFALSKVKGEWVLFIDSDEIVSRDLGIEIMQKIKSHNVVAGFMLIRRDILWGKQLHFGENGKMSLLRLARKDAGKWDGKVHERWHVEGNVASLVAPLWHYPHPTIAEFLDSMNGYTSIRAEELFKNGVDVTWFDILLYPKAKFIQDYVFKLGFLDGIRGLIAALIMSFHSFLVRGKLWQLQKNK